MSDTLVLAIVASVVSPAVLAIIAFFILRLQKKQDWAREDAVAKAAEERDQRAQKRQEEVASKAEEAATLLLASNERVATANGQIGGKLDVIHGLVNSGLTASMQDTLDQATLNLTLLKVIDRANPSIEGKAAIKATAAKVLDLANSIADRTVAAEALTAEAAASGLGPQGAPAT